MSKQPDSVWIGLDLGGTKMQAVLFDSRFNVIARRRKKTRGYEGSMSGLERISSLIDKILDDAMIPREQLAGIGLGCPGPIDLENGVVVEAPNLGWKKVPVRENLEQIYHVSVSVCNDVDAGVYGEYRFGACRDAHCALGVFPGTGIGAGLVYDGNVFRGKVFSCLELGHIPTVTDGALCGCGRRGCLETVASRLAIGAEISKAAYRGQAPHLLRIAGTDLANIRSGALAEAIAAGDKCVEEIVRHGAKTLGRAIAGIVNLLNPDVLVLGGGLVESLPKIYVEEVGKSLERYVMPSYKSVCEIRTAELGDDAGAMGAAAWAAEQSEEGVGAKT